ncbi:hypothetical protein [Bacillus sp. FJAT-27251]|uniref:hypothetical protein n=1 Tax=Bacillus sp. FJAT-27251 TaxID=1684142 RepID=UPI0006A7DF33|nr:hypothetical protein [Bacillus sp. FJAT-27251]
MCGWVKLSRDIVDTELWREVVPFRLFVFLLIKASREERVVNGFMLKRGQYIRAYSKLAEDLGYREGRGEKLYSKSTIKRASDKLVKKGLVAVEETAVGTLFTVLAYDDIQDSGFVEFFYPSFRGTEKEPSSNQNGQKSKPYQEEEKKVEKVKKKNDDGPREPQHGGQAGDARVAALTEKFLSLRGRGTTLSPSDMNAIERVAALQVPLEQLLLWMDEIHAAYASQSPGESISSMKYYEAAISTKSRKSRMKSQPDSQSLKERILLLERQGKIEPGEGDGHGQR